VQTDAQISNVVVFACFIIKCDVFCCIIYAVLTILVSCYTG